MNKCHAKTEKSWDFVGTVPMGHMGTFCKSHSVSLGVYVCDVAHGHGTQAFKVY